jgi:glycosyltransferase involved in cell wall biosynthesis
MPPPASRGQLRRTRPNLKRVDAHVVVTAALGQLLEETIGVSQRKIHLIYNGVEDRPIAPVERPVDGPIIGTVGRLSWEKGQDILVRALPSLPGVTAVFVGSGPDREKLERTARELGVADRTRFLGWQPDARAWLPTFDVFVMPSVDEALPLAITEAMLASRPVVATRIGGVPETVLENQTGLLVPPGDPNALADAVRAIIEDAELRERMGREGRRVAKKRFDLDQMVRSYESLYAALLGSSGGPSHPAGIA